jgi:hypothetical protein
MSRSVAILAVCASVLAACSGEEPGEDQTVVADFRAGQVRKYETRPGEEASRLVVCRVEPNEKLGTIVHIYVQGVAIRSSVSPDLVTRVVGHMPFAESALRQSVVTLESSREPLPEYQEGYNNWRDAFDGQKAGIFTISVAGAIDFMEEALNR